MAKMRWRLKPRVPHHIVEARGELSPILVQLLYNRGIIGLHDAQAFLSGDSRLSGDPFLLPDMAKAVERILQAIAHDEEMAVYGDFDGDGITATVLLVKAISALGGRVRPYIPNRFTEGYGVNQDALASLRADGVALVITVDCGTSSLGELLFAQEIGLDVVVTDHHSIHEGLPPAVAVVNLQRSDHSYPFRDLCGVGTAFKLSQALREASGGSPYCDDDFLDLVAIGTVTDVVPLTGENRYLVKAGLGVMNSSPRLGLRALVERAGLTPGKLDASHIGYSLGPRINAMGRLDHALVSYQLLSTDSPEEAAELAAVLDEKNRERQRLTQDAQEMALQQVSAEGASVSILITASPDYHSGVVGIVASKLVEAWYRPAVVIEVGPEVSRGSCRSIPEFDIAGALAECHHLFLRYGGHPKAAGFTIPTENIPALREGLTAIAERELGDLDLASSLDIDAEMPLSAAA
ncbi:MAG: recJ [Dehalococcoidia bacterium]|nr:recJ [Dehalococcoidia bacterium]